MSRSEGSTVRPEEVDLLGSLQRHTPSPVPKFISEKGKERMPPPPSAQERAEARAHKPRPISFALQPGQYIPFRPRRRFPPDTKLNSILGYAETMIGEDNPKQAIATPPNITTNEWLAVNAFLYFNKVNEFLGVIKDECKCQKMSVGPKHEYLWADGKTIRKPISIPAIDYIEYVMEWCEANFDDTKMFPDYDETIKALFKRLFRVFGHMELEHREVLESKGIAREHDMVFRCLVKFIKEYRLMEKKSLIPIAKTIERWKSEKKQFEKLTRSLSKQ